MSMFASDSSCRTATSVSGIAIKFINDVVSKMDDGYVKENVHFGSNEYCIVGSHSYFYDLTDASTKRIVEFNGDLWHANPNKFEEDGVNPLNHTVCGDKWLYDADKIQTALDAGFDVLVVWESDYHKFKNRIVDRARQFLRGENVDVSDMCNIKYPSSDGRYDVLNKLYESRYS